MDATLNPTVIDSNLAHPPLGLGLWGQRAGLETETAVASALEAGYRLFDSAPVYGNEKSLGLALAKSGLKRAGYFVTGKIWLDDEGQNGPRLATLKSLANLGLSYFDLLLIHWPSPLSHLTFLALNDLKAQKLTRAIGVANFSWPQVLALQASTGLWPEVWQLEFHPFLVRSEILKVAAQKGIVLEAACPLARGRLKKNQILGRLAHKYQKTWAQVLLRWHLQKGLCPLPKSVRPARILENAALFDFALEPKDLAALDRLNQNHSVLKPPFVFDGAGYVISHA
ncbi:MAG: aldo/keto reductase [Deltaproteobacteria bacterium]|jgi:diketogulonate reductase-like aldo/keto reductase|nr:aldo/keto reductase [Deltaproteobacteria bacterium]